MTSPDKVVHEAIARPGAIVMLHGFLGSPASWDEVCARLGPGPQLVRPTLFGHELPSDPDRDETRVDSFDAELVRLADVLGRLALPRPRWLVGYSLGARVALGLAASSPEPFDRLVLVSGRDGLEDADEAASRAALDAALARTLREEGLPAFVDRWQGLPLFASQKVLPEERRAAHRARRVAHDPERLSLALEILSLGRMPRYAARAAARTRKITLIVGEHDAKFRALAEGFARRFGASLHVVRGAGHDVVLERPDALAEILEARHD